MNTQSASAEALRLAAVEAVSWPAAKSDVALDDIVDLAAETFGAPIAIISLAERELQVAIASRGAARVSAAREITFCRHTLAGADTLVVPDATQDERFAANPFVMNTPGVRFYAGALLRSEEGHLLGTLCIIDNKPREDLTDAQRQRLERLARLAEQRLQSRAVQKRLAAAQEERVEAEAYAQSVLQEAIGAFIACDRIALNLEGRVRAGVMRVQRELNGAGRASAEAAALRDMIDELATAVRLDRSSAKQTLFEPSAMLRAIVSDLSAEASERKVYLNHQDSAAGCDMLGDSWRFEELIEGVLTDCIATTQGPLEITSSFETLPGGHEHLAVRFKAQHSSAPWRLAARYRELTDALAGCWEVSHDACAITIFLPARLRTRTAKAATPPEWGANILSFDKARKGSQ